MAPLILPPHRYARADSSSLLHPDDTTYYKNLPDVHPVVQSYERIPTVMQMKPSEAVHLPQ
ncbi:MAG: hypothetical protein IJ191_02435 [Treponema sp.]|nr:hypothetical protein [Treponema sp.]